MNYYEQMDQQTLTHEYEKLLSQYEIIKQQGLSLNMSRGVPSTKQLELSMPLLQTLQGENVFGQSGIDERNYGQLDGIESAKKLFAELLDLSTDEVVVGGNSSLNLMYDTISRGMLKGVVDSPRPWKEEPSIKCLCPVPGYDRHFAISEFFNIEMISIPLTAQGPDMDLVERLVAEDPLIKFIWCVPKYSNPTGTSYTDETVRRFANMKPAAKDFRIIWDNAYCVHDLTDTSDSLLNLLDECKKAGHPNRALQFMSMSKITFAGAGVAVMSGSEENMINLKKQLSVQTIGYDKLNQLAHVRFFKDVHGVLAHMKKHRNILAPKFDLVVEKLNQEISPMGLGCFHRPRGGYFVSFDALPGCAKKVVSLCKQAGVILTGAGATFPYQKDPMDQNIRLAPTFPPLKELEQAMELFCLCVKLASVEKYIHKA